MMIIIITVLVAVIVETIPTILVSEFIIQKQRLFLSEHAIQ